VLSCNAPKARAFRRPAGNKTLALHLDAAIYGADLPNDPTLTSLIPDPQAAGLKWYAQHRRRVDVHQELAEANPAARKEIYRLPRGQCGGRAFRKQARSIPFFSDSLPAGRRRKRPLTTRCNKASSREKSTSRNCSTRARGSSKADRAWAPRPYRFTYFFQ
jgi:hypothetical protein